MIKIEREAVQIPIQAPFIVYSRKYKVHYLIYKEDILHFSMIRLENGHKQNYNARSIEELMNMIEDHDIEIVNATIKY